MSWKARLRHAATRKRFTRAAKDDAANWNSCAIGENKERLGLVSEDMITRQTVESQFPPLYKLGMAFGQAVNNDQVARATKLYTQINRRLDAVYGR